MKRRGKMDSLLKYRKEIKDNSLTLARKALKLSDGVYLSAKMSLWKATELLEDLVKRKDVEEGNGKKVKVGSKDEVQKSAIKFKGKKSDL